VHEGSGSDRDEPVEQGQASVEQENAEDLDGLGAELGEVREDVSGLRE
jgi:hypothetical protein